MSNTSSSNTVQINDQDAEKTQFLKIALNCKSENEVISESINVTHRVVRVIQTGGTVVLTEKNGKSNEMLIKT